MASDKWRRSGFQETSSSGRGGQRQGDPAASSKAAAADSGGLIGTEDGFAESIGDLVELCQDIDQGRVIGCGRRRYGHRVSRARLPVRRSSSGLR